MSAVDDTITCVHTRTQAHTKCDRVVAVCICVSAYTRSLTSHHHSTIYHHTTAAACTCERACVVRKQTPPARHIPNRIAARQRTRGYDTARNHIVINLASQRFGEVFDCSLNHNLWFINTESADLCAMQRQRQACSIYMYTTNGNAHQPT